MKIGFIFECGPDGPDVQVCHHLVHKLDSTIQFVPNTLDNKKKLVEDCGPVAKALLIECKKVIIVWDLYPAWREKGIKPCPFLEGNLCSNYDHRPGDCRSFPHLHKHDFIFRLWNVADNCAVCPIVFNVYERLKIVFAFRY
jgi:Fe-S-cluster containining protein